MGRRRIKRRMYTEMTSLCGATTASSSRGVCRCKVGAKRPLSHQRGSPRSAHDVSPLQRVLGLMWQEHLDHPDQMSDAHTTLIGSFRCQVAAALLRVPFWLLQCQGYEQIYPEVFRLCPAKSWVLLPPPGYTSSPG